jgi:hypothetical protein
MISIDVEVEGESDSIDPDIRRRDRGPLLRICPSALSISRSCHGACAVTSRQRENWTRNNQIMLSRSSGLGFACSTRLLYRVSQRMLLAIAAIEGHGVDGVMVHGGRQG